MFKDGSAENSDVCLTEFGYFKDEVALNRMGTKTNSEQTIVVSFNVPLKAFNSQRYPECV